MTVGGEGCAGGYERASSSVPSAHRMGDAVVLRSGAKYSREKRATVSGRWQARRRKCRLLLVEHAEDGDDAGVGHQGIAEGAEDGLAHVLVRGALRRDLEDHAEDLGLHAAAFMNSASDAVARIRGTGSSALNASVNAFSRLQSVRGLKSSCAGSKYARWTGRARCFGTSTASSTNAR